MTAGTHTSAVPTSGTTEAKAVSTPKTTGEGRPTMAKPVPRSAPWATAVSNMPSTSARVTAERCSRSAAFLGSSIGTRRSVQRTSSSPSRRKKKSRNSTRTSPTTAPRTPVTAAPLAPISVRRRLRLFWTSHAWTWSALIGANDPTHRRSRVAIGTRSRSLACEMW